GLFHRARAPVVLAVAERRGTRQRLLLPVPVPGGGRRGPAQPRRAPVRQTQVDYGTPVPNRRGRAPGATHRTVVPAWTAMAGRERRPDARSRTRGTDAGRQPSGGRACGGTGAGGR